MQTTYHVGKFPRLNLILINVLIILFDLAQARKELVKLATLFGRESGDSQLFGLCRDLQSKQKVNRAQVRVDVIRAEK